jgi:exonuclease VII small subunit
MAEPHVVSTLCSKRDELERLISSYEKSVAIARSDLAHINATLELLERDDVKTTYASRLSIVRMFKRGEILALCQAALAEAEGEMDTRELAIAVIRAKNMDEPDQVLRQAIAFRVVQVMLRQKGRGQITTTGKRKGVRIWQLRTSQFHKELTKVNHT